VTLHPISLPRPVNDSLPAPIFGSRMSQSGRQHQFAVRFTEEVSIRQVATYSVEKLLNSFSFSRS